MVLPTMDFWLEKKLKSSTAVSEWHVYGYINIEAGWYQLREYFNKTARATTHNIASIVLNPTQK